MNKSELKQLIESSVGFDDFIDGKQSQLKVIVCGVPVYINRGDNNSDYCYQLPYKAEYNYSVAFEFLKNAIPIISRILNEKNTQRLTKSDF